MSESNRSRPEFDGDMLEQQVPVVTGLEAQTRGEIDIQISTAKRYPRSVSRVLKEAMTLATMSEEVAEQCFYAVPRDGKTIEGPSARLAEIMASCWGHMRAEARIVEETETHVVARGTSWDLERNVAVAFEVRRRITTSEKKDRRTGAVIPSKRFGDDMITTTSNAANSIAFRNSVFRVIPKAFWHPIYEAARKVAIGDAETLVSKRTKMLAYFQRMGVTEARLFTAIKVNGADDITLEHLATLKGIATAIKDGDTTVDDAFPELLKEPQRVQTPPPNAPAPSAPASTTPAEAPAAAPPAAAPPSSPAAPAPAPANVAPGDQVLAGVSVVNTESSKNADGSWLYSVLTSEGMFHTKSQEIYSALAVLEGTDHTARLTFRVARKGGQAARVIVAVEVEEPRAAEEGGDR